MRKKQVRQLQQEYRDLLAVCDEKFKAYEEAVFYGPSAGGILKEK